MKKEEIDINLSGQLKFETNVDGFIKSVSIDGIEITSIFIRLNNQQVKLSISNKFEDDKQ